MVTKAELRREIAELRKVGQIMSNLMHNFANTIDVGHGDSLPRYYGTKKQTVKELRGLYQKWDSVKRADG